MKESKQTKNVKINPIYHEYLSNKAGRGGKIFVTLENIIEEDMNKEGNRKFTPLGLCGVTSAAEVK